MGILCSRIIKRSLLKRQLHLQPSTSTLATTSHFDIPDDKLYRGAKQADQHQNQEEFVVHEGRTFLSRFHRPAVAGNLIYPLPCDDEELERLNLQVNERGARVCVDELLLFIVMCPRLSVPFNTNSITCFDTHSNVSAHHDLPPTLRWNE
ncbi:hypothetical protein HK104_006146 [Borealophlyctis nickersoniae]|nr:hypothetical protein HK104_006146 [Borealophlyctis nickersoniae]